MMVRKLTRRLVDVDLLDQAEDLLKYQAENRLDGVPRIQSGMLRGPGTVRRGTRDDLEALVGLRDQRPVFLKRFADGDHCVVAVISDRITPGVVYTTFHHPFSGANVVTTDNSDWATNCPEYKVTAVQASKVTKLSDWQLKFAKFTEEQLGHLDRARRPEKVS